MKFKVGDKVKIVDEVKNLALETPFGTVIIDKNSYPWLKKWLGKVVTIDTAHDGYYTTLEIKGYYLNDEMIEGLAEESDDFEKMYMESEKRYEEKYSKGEYCHEQSFKWGFQEGYDYAHENEKLEINLKNGYEFKYENENVINATKIVLEKKKKEYPKTYEECCKVMNYCCNPVATKTTHKEELIRKFQFLLLYRDAYWKIAGEEMGLGKSWEPDWNSKLYYLYYNPTNTTGVVRGFTSDGVLAYIVLAFPTEEMRDAFYENFKVLIEECKELL